MCIIGRIGKKVRKNVTYLNRKNYVEEMKKKIVTVVV